MALLNVLQIPDPRLNKTAKPVVEVDDALRRFMQDMLETMYESKGIGLAATQVGVLKQVIVIDLQELDQERSKDFYPLYLINPQITYTSEEQREFDEGCLSVGTEIINVKRPKAIALEYMDYNGAEQKLEDDGFLARVVQHEMDHLIGKTIVNYLSKFKRDLLIKKLSKVAALAA